MNIVHSFRLVAFYTSSWNSSLANLANLANGLPLAVKGFIKQSFATLCQLNLYINYT
jgi:hypothetical protein